jgi:calcineurin-like phosphoesterase family protein
MRKFNDPSVQYFFTADTHFGHSSIIKYDGQSYKDIYQRDQDIVTKWNETVHSRDSVFLLGDVGFLSDIDYIRSIVASLNGHKYFIKGNHDSRDQIKMFEEFGEYLGLLAEVIVMKQMISLCHYRMDFWRQSHKQSWHLHGHSHCCLPEQKHKMTYDVGINGNGMKPYSFSQINTIMSKKDFVPDYHHAVFTDKSRQ